MAEQRKLLGKLGILSLEQYHYFFNNPLLISSTFNFDQLNHILHIHGFSKLNHQNRRKEIILEALGAIDEFMNPHRSTLLSETQISQDNDVCLSIDEVAADLDTLQWHDFDDEDEDDDNGGEYMEKVENKRKRKVFDPVHLKKPRSKIKTQRRKDLMGRGDDKAWGACWSSPRVHKRSGVRYQEIKFEDGIYIWPSSFSKTPMGIGFNLMKAIEEWLAKNGAEYVYLATEENNVASRNLFTVKCHYKEWSSLQISVLPIEKSVKKLSGNINIDKLQVNQAVSIYKNQLKYKDFYPNDIETILRGNPSLGTWACYFNDEGCWEGLHIKDHSSDTAEPSSWIIFSLWNSREIYKLQIHRSSHRFQYIIYAALSHAREVIFPCLKLPSACGSFQKPFGFLFMYGVLGEGKRVRELMKAVWNFAAKLGVDVDCKLVMAEVGDSDPLKKYIPLEPSMLCIKDVWYFKNMAEHHGNNNEEKTTGFSGALGNVFIDPRDF